MPKATVREESEYRLPAAQLFTGRLDLVKERVNEFVYKEHHKAVQDGRQRAGDKGEIREWRWEFAITEGEFEGQKAYLDTRPQITSRADDKVRQIAETLLGRTVEIGEEFDTDLIVGLPCQFTVRHDDPVSKKDGTSFYACPVDDVFPVTGTEDFVPF